MGTTSSPAAGVFDRRFVRTFKQFLLRYNDLRDCAYAARIDGGKHLHRFKDEHLEELRNHPRQHYVLIEGDRRNTRLYRSHYTPTLDDLAAHLCLGGVQTIWTANSANTDTLLMLADIDTKDGGGDAQTAAEHLSNQYLDGAGFIEPSTGGIGRHCYFKISVKFEKRVMVVEKMQEIANRIREDRRFEELGCSLDRVFYGLPTLWRQEEGHWRIMKRGDCLKLPYCGRGQGDLDCLRQIEEISFNAFVASFPQKVCVAVPSTAPISPSGVCDTRYGAQASRPPTKANATNRSLEMLKGPDVIRSRFAAYLVANQQLGRKATPEEACAIYEVHGAATGERHAERIQFFERIEPLIGVPDKRSDPHWFTDEDVVMMADQLKVKIDGLLTEANGRMKALRRGTLTVEDVALLALFQRKTILTNDGYCGNAMVRGFVKHRKKTHRTQKYLNAHHVKEAFEILERVGFSRMIEGAVHDPKDRSKGRPRRYELCRAPYLVSNSTPAEIANTAA